MFYVFSWPTSEHFVQTLRPNKKNFLDFILHLGTSREAFNGNVYSETKVLTEGGIKKFINSKKCTRSKIWEKKVAKKVNGFFQSCFLESCRSKRTLNLRSHPALNPNFAIYNKPALKQIRPTLHNFAADKGDLKLGIKFSYRIFFESVFLKECQSAWNDQVFIWNSSKWLKWEEERKSYTIFYREVKWQVVYISENFFLFLCLSGICFTRQAIALEIMDGQLKKTFYGELLEYQGCAA